MSKLEAALESLTLDDVNQALDDVDQQILNLEAEVERLGELKRSLKALADVVAASRPLPVRAAVPTESDTPVLAVLSEPQTETAGPIEIDQRTRSEPRDLKVNSDVVASVLSDRDWMTVTKICQAAGLTRSQVYYVIRNESNRFEERQQIGKWKAYRLRPASVPIHAHEAG